MFESEEDLIVRRIKEYIIKYIIKEELPGFFYIMLKNGRIMDIRDYSGMVSYGKINPQDAYVYIGIGWAKYKADFYYPFLGMYGTLVFGYLSKLGFYNWPLVAPATGLKYVADAEVYRDYLLIELVNLDVAVNNTNLPKIVADILGEKLVSGEKVLIREEDEKIFEMISQQRLFAGHIPNEAWSIIYYYYDKGYESLAKEAARIAMDYDRIFQPYRFCYDMEAREEVDCSSINLD